MFFKEYLDELYYEELLNNYDYNYLNTIDYDNFKKIYDLLIKYEFNYIEDIILKYISIFELEPNYLERCILKYKEKLGTNYVKIMGNDMRYFNAIIDKDEK